MEFLLTPLCADSITQFLDGLWQVARRRCACLHAVQDGEQGPCFGALHKLQKVPPRSRAAFFVEHDDAKDNIPRLQSLYGGQAQTPNVKARALTAVRVKVDETNSPRHRLPFEKNGIAVLVSAVVYGSNPGKAPKWSRLGVIVSESSEKGIQR